MRIANQRLPSTRPCFFHTVKSRRLGSTSRPCTGIPGLHCATHLQKVWRRSQEMSKRVKREFKIQEIGLFPVMLRRRRIQTRFPLKESGLMDWMPKKLTLVMKEQWIQQTSLIPPILQLLANSNAWWRMKTAMLKSPGPSIDVMSVAEHSLAPVLS